MNSRFSTSRLELMHWELVIRLHKALIASSEATHNPSHAAHLLVIWHR